WSTSCFINRPGCCKLRPAGRLGHQSTLYWANLLASRRASEGPNLPHLLRPFRSLLVVVLAPLFFAATTSLATAQVARASGIVKDASGLPIKGATIRAENPDASLSTITAATDDKGRFAIIGFCGGGMGVSG